MTNSEMALRAELKRQQAIIKAIVGRLKWLDGYTGENATHHGVRLAKDMMRYEINRARQVNPKHPLEAVKE